MLCLALRSLTAAREKDEVGDAKTCAQAYTTRISENIEGIVSQLVYLRMGFKPLLG